MTASTHIKVYDATTAAAATFYAAFDATVAEEAAALRDARPDVIVCDASPLGLAVAAALGVPSLFIGNFTWDWIYETHGDLATRAPHVIPAIRRAHALATAASLAVTLPMAWWLEPMRIVWNGDVVFAMAWSVFVLTAGGISLMFYMLRHGRVTAVSSTMYLVPSVTSVMAWLLFGETLGAQAIAGMGVTLLGVYLVVAKK